MPPQSSMSAGEFRREFLRWSVVMALLLAGVAIGILLWNFIKPEYHNPQNVYGALAKSGIDKSTNSVRYAVFICVSLLPLVCSFAFTKFRAWLFKMPKSLACIDDHSKFCSRSASLAVVTVICALIASHYYHLDTAPGSDKPLMDHFHHGEVTATVVADEHGYVPYRDYFPSRGMAVDVLKAKLAFSLFGRSQASLIIMDSILMLMGYAAIAWLLLKWFGGNYLASALSAVALLGFSLVSFIVPVRFSERDVVYALLLILLLALIRSKSPKSILFSSGLLVALMPLSFVISIDRGFMLLAMLVIVLPVFYFIIFQDRPNRRALVLGSLLGASAGIAILGYSIEWNFRGFVQFVFMDFPVYREYVEGLEYFISSHHLRGSIYRIYGLLIQSLVAMWITYRFLAHLTAEKQKFWRATAAFIRANTFEFFFALFALLAFRYALGRADRPHIATGASWSTLFLLYAVVRYLLPQFLRFRNSRRALIAIMIVVGLGSVAALARDYFGNDRFRFAYPFGISDRDMLTDDYLQAADSLRGMLSDKHKFASLTNEGSWYYLFDQPSPLLFAVLWYGSSDKYQDVMVNQLESNPIDYVLYSNASVWRNIDSVSIRDRVPKVFEYVDAHFEPYRTYGSQEIWIRRGFTP